ncbi:MAG: AI-2E family transporter [Acidimicrobiaceae bacterium]|nr:AI-2E family transporter [Acidimicrobiaceae bacterium]
MRHYARAVTDDAPGPDDRTPDGDPSSDPAAGAPVTQEYGVTIPPADESSVPGWVIRSIALFWIGFLAVAVAGHLWSRLQGLTLLLLISMFLALAIEPGVNRLARRGWRRGSATASIMFGFLLITAVFVGAIGTLVGTQLVDLLQNSEDYITDTVDRVNDLFGTELDPQEIVDEFNDPDGRVQQFIDAQQDRAIGLSLQALNGLLAFFSILLFTYYLVADGPRLRRAICSRLRPDRQRQVLAAWELAINKTGGYLYSRLLLALLSAFFHWIVFQAAAIQAPIPLALWVGLVSQFLPVVGTYIAGVLPVLITFLDSPVKAAIVLGFIIVYQQVENYFFAPRITARTMELHPAVAFGAALAGFALLGAAGAVLALPAAAMMQAIIGGWGQRHEVIENQLTEMRLPGRAPPAGDAP